MNTLIPQKAGWWRVLGLVLLTFTLLILVLGVRLYNEPHLIMGTLADTNILAPTDAMLTDQEATESARENIRQQSIQIFQSLEDRNGRMRQRLEGLLQDGDGLILSLGTFPFISGTSFSIDQQRQLQALDSIQWQVVQQTQPVTPADSPLRQSYQKWLKKRPTKNQIALTTSQIEKARSRYAATQNLLTALPDFYHGLLTLTKSEWQQLRQESKRVCNQLLAVGIMPGLPDELRRRGINALITPSIKGSQRQLVSDLVDSVLEPNLRIDRFATMMATESKAATVSPVIIPIKQGQLLIEKGQLITPRLFNMLDKLDLTRRGVNWPGLAVLAGLLGLALTGFAIGQKLLKADLRLQDIGLLTTLAVLTALLGIFIPHAWTQFMPLVLLGLLVGSYYGSRLGLLTVVCLTPALLYGWSLIHGRAHLLPVLVGGIAAALLVDRLRSRAQIALAGAGIALLQAVAHLLWVLVINGWAALSPKLLLMSLLYGAGGLLWSIVALGLSPYLETIFDVVTPVRLAELSNPNTGLLKKLMTEAPGTYQHTLFVANLATAAAQVLGDNADLVRAGTLYHDIGKMRRPQYFIENQMGLVNPHDQLDDPWLSAQLIRDHVADGLAMAQKYKLPKVIQNFIPEHQGTIRIAYFLHQAKQLHEREVRDEDFQYAGPIPQSRETGLVMLADACEAALRSLNLDAKTDPFALVRRILQARWDERQLIDSGLKATELDTIACTFIKVWKETNHRRIRYPNQPGGKRRELVSPRG